ncbi:hypothetical protein ACFL4O_00745 [bacterium]
MKQRLLFLFLLIFLTTKALGADIFDVSKAGTSAEMISIGNIEGFSNGAESVFNNPGGLCRTKKYSLSAFNTEIIDEVTYTNGAFGVYTDAGYFGIGHMYMGISDITHTEEVSGRFRVKEKFKYKNSITKFVYAREFIPAINIGAGLSYYHNKNHTVTGNGFNADIGLTADVLEYLEASLAVKNILYFSDMEYSNDGEENIPVQMVLGGKVKTPAGLDIFGQFKKIETRGKLLKSIGIKYSPVMLDIVNLGLGYKEEFVLDDIQGTFGLGLGVEMFGVGINYAYSKNDYIENDKEHYFSIKFDL